MIPGAAGQDTYSDSMETEILIQAGFLLIVWETVRAPQAPA